LFFSIQILPWDWKFYRQLFAIDWTSPHFKKLLDVVTYLPSVIETERWGPASFINWAIFAIISAVVTVIWAAYDKRASDYNFLYYLLRAGLRYKAGIGLFALGFYMLFQQQIPYPSLSNLHTNYGDLFAWKLYYQTTAINPGYESFLGFVEILAGVLILYPRTVTFGTGLLLGFLGNVAMVNLYYDVGHHTLVNFLLLASLFLFSYDVPRLYALLVKGSKSVGKKFYPVWSGNLKYARMVLRSATLLLVVLLAVQSYALLNKPYKVSQTAGIEGSYGYYIPTTFKLNGEILPYSTTDPNRWQDVIFEKWATISIRVNRPVVVDVTDGDAVNENDIDRNYEVAGAGGRHYFDYKKDPDQNIIRLQNKNAHHKAELMNLSFSFPSDSTMVLQGTNEKNDSIYVELLRIKKKYFMYEGRRSRIKI
jgi:hypothetical protein